MDSAERSTRIRLTIIISAIVAAALAVGTFGWFYLSSQEDSSNPIKSDVIISKEDQNLLSVVSEDFVKSAGNFGFVSQKINSDTILEIANLANTSSFGEYVKTRGDVYTSLKTNFILKGGLLDYDPNLTVGWQSDEENITMASYEVSSLNVTPQEKGSTVEINGVKKEIAYVNVVFSSKEIRREVTATDSSWDGTFQVSEKKFLDNTMQIAFVKDSENTWKVYSADGPKNLFLLAIWKNPGADTFQIEQSGFQKTDSIKAPGVTPAPEEPGEEDTTTPLPDTENPGDETTNPTETPGER